MIHQKWNCPGFGPVSLHIENSALESWYLWQRKTPQSTNFIFQLLLCFFLSAVVTVWWASIKSWDSIMCKAPWHHSQCHSYKFIILFLFGLEWCQNRGKGDFYDRNIWICWRWTFNIIQVAMEDWDGWVICLGNKVNAVRSRQTPLKKSNTR